MSDGVDSVFGASSANTVATYNSAPKLSQSDFLKVLVAQYSNQIPTDAQDSNQFYNDLMSLSNYTAIQDSAVKLSGLTAQQMVGKTVRVNLTDGSTSTGTVSSVSSDGVDWYVVVNDASYLISRVTNITNPASSSTNTAN